MKQVNKKNIYQSFKTYRDEAPLSFVLLILAMPIGTDYRQRPAVYIGFILVKGIPNITPDPFAWEYTSENVSLYAGNRKYVVNDRSRPSLFWQCLRHIFRHLSGGIRKTQQQNCGCYRITTETLAVNTIHQYTVCLVCCCFVSALGWGFSMISGAFTLAIMILPIIMRTTEEALKSVPTPTGKAALPGCR